jgi:hypothetical protein
MLLIFTWQSESSMKKMAKQHENLEKKINWFFFNYLFSFFYNLFTLFHSDSQTKIQWTWCWLSLSDNIERLWWVGEALSIIFAEIDAIYRHLKWMKLNTHCLWHQIKSAFDKMTFFIMICIIFTVNYL